MNKDKIAAALLKKKVEKTAFNDAIKQELEVLNIIKTDTKSKIETAHSNITYLNIELGTLKNTCKKISSDKQNILDHISETEHEIDAIITRSHTFDSKLNSKKQELTSKLKSFGDELSIQKQTLLSTLNLISKDYADIVTSPITQLNQECNHYANTNSTYAKSIGELQRIIDTSKDSLIIVEPNEELPFVINTTLTAGMSPADDYRTNTNQLGCGCGTEEYFTTEFKLLKQSWANDSICHLLIKRASKYIDYVSSECPLQSDSIKVKRMNVPIARWNMVGDLSAWHQLNDRKSNCTIKQLDAGIAKIKLDEKTYTMQVEFKGDVMHETIRFDKLDPKSNEWNMNRGV